MGYRRTLVMWLTISVQAVLVQGQVLASDAVTELGKRLVARRGTLAQGTIDYETWVFVTNTAVYDRLRTTIMQAQYRRSADDITKLLTSIGQSEGTKATTGFAGSWYYDFTEGDQWRITRARLPEFAPPPDTNQTGPASPRTEDVAFNGQYVTSVQNNEYVLYRTKAAVLDYPQAMELDMSLAPWHAMLEKGANPGQRITATTDNDEHTLVFATEKPGPQASSAAYVYSASLGYAPLRTVAEVGGNVKAEMLHAYTVDRKGTALPTPALTMKADFTGGGRVRLVVWHIKTWRDSVRKDDLKPILPDSYVMVDQRFGKAPRFISHDAEGEMIKRSLEEMDKTVGNQATITTSGPDGASGERNTPNPNPTKPLTGQDSQLAPRTSRQWLWLGIVGAAVALTVVAGVLIRRGRTHAESAKLE